MHNIIVDIIARLIGFINKMERDALFLGGATKDNRDIDIKKFLEKYCNYGRAKYLRDCRIKYHILIILITPKPKNDLRDVADVKKYLIDNLGFSEAKSIKLSDSRLR